MSGKKSKPFSKRVTLRRVATLGRYDIGTAYEILDNTFYLFIGYEREGQSFVTPTAHWRDGNEVYFHGSLGSKTLVNSKKQSISAFATLVDGIVIARSGFNHSVNHRSLLILGKPEEVTDFDEKKRQLDFFIDKLFPGRSERVRPPHKKEILATMVLKMPIEEFSIKIRDGNVDDEPEDESFPVWAGVLPLSYTAFGAVKCPKLSPEESEEPGIPYFIEKFADGKPPKIRS